MVFCTLGIKAHLHFLQEDAQYAVRQLEKLLQKDVIQADVWHILSGVLLRYFPHHGTAITNSAKSSLVLDKVVTKVTLITLLGEWVHLYVFPPFFKGRQP